ncbi:Uncharacterised protein [uncultured archaeon]|nr:Uncharacterised protein [uncultured archaeon]
MNNFLKRGNRGNKNRVEVTVKSISIMILLPLLPLLPLSILAREERKNIRPKDHPRTTSPGLSPLCKKGVTEVTKVTRGLPILLFLLLLTQIRGNNGVTPEVTGSKQSKPRNKWRRWV